MFAADLLATQAACRAHNAHTLDSLAVCKPVATAAPPLPCPVCGSNPDPKACNVVCVPPLPRLQKH